MTREELIEAIVEATKVNMLWTKLLTGKDKQNFRKHLEHMRTLGTKGSVRMFKGVPIKTR